MGMASSFLLTTPTKHSKVNDHYPFARVLICFQMVDALIPPRLQDQYPSASSLWVCVYYNKIMSEGWWIASMRQGRGVYLTSLPTDHRAHYIIWLYCLYYAHTTFTPPLQLTCWSCVWLLRWRKVWYRDPQLSMMGTPHSQREHRPHADTFQEDTRVSVCGWGYIVTSVSPPYGILNKITLIS